MVCSSWNKILRVYTYEEFVKDYGSVMITEGCDSLLTSGGMTVSFSSHFKAALDNRIIELSECSLKHYYFVLSSHDDYDSNGTKFENIQWYLYLKQYLRPISDNAHFIIFKNVKNYLIARRKNFTKILIQQEDNKFIELDHVDIYEFIKEADNRYTIKTSRGDLSSSYISARFIYAFIELMGIDSNAQSFVLYRDGKYESIESSPSLSVF